MSISASSIKHRLRHEAFVCDILCIDINNVFMYKLHKMYNTVLRPVNVMVKIHVCIVNALNFNMLFH